MVARYRFVSLSKYHNAYFTYPCDCQPGSDRGSIPRNIINPFMYKYMEKNIIFLVEKYRQSKGWGRASIAHSTTAHIQLGTQKDDAQQDFTQENSANTL